MVALAFPAAASAHARFVGSKPADGSVLDSAPADVRLLFDDEIRPAGGDRAVDDKGRSVLEAKVHRLDGNPRALVVPLRPNLPRGSYTVRWRAVSDDGHLLQGVLAFAVGAGSPRPVPTLSVGGGLSASSIVLRLLFLAGVLLAGGGALAGRVLLEPARRGYETATVGVGLLMVEGGGFGLLALEPAVEDTRFGRVVETAAIVGLVGVAAALATLRIPPLAYAASAAGLLVLAAPTLSGHALDPRPARVPIALADFAHVAAAAFWIGGIVLLAASGSALARRRFPMLALGALAVLGLAAIPRAVAALSSAADLVETGYGRALIVKSALVAAVVAIAWLNRHRLGRLGLGAELVVLAGVVAAVAILTDLRPPGQVSAALAGSSRPAAPRRDAVVLAGQDDDVAVALAAAPQGRDMAVRITALGPEGLGLDGFRVRVDGAETTRCGSGCYAATVPVPQPPRRLAVSLSGEGRDPATIAFTLPRQWPAPSAAAVVRRATRAYRALRTLVIDEHLASSARDAIDTTFRIAAPDRLAYKIRNGPEAVVIGPIRWDRLPGGRWERSEIDPLRQPEPFWGDRVRNARVLGSGRVDGRPVSIVSFYDPELPAWFEVSLEQGTARPLAMRMTAQAHFMRHRYRGFDAPHEIRPPLR